MSKEKDKERILIDAIKHLLQDNTVVRQMFQHFNVPVSKLDKMPVEFAKLKSSAKTKNGQVYLNHKLLDDGDFKDDIMYVVHEACHWLQQHSADNEKYKKYPDVDYLDLPAEAEAFAFQAAYIADVKGKEDAEQYIDELLDFHEFTKGKERNNKKKELLSRVLE